MGSVVRREAVLSGAVVVRPLLGAPEPPPAADTAAHEAPPDPTGRQLRLLNELAASLARERSRQLSELRPELLRLVLEVCRVLLGREAQTDPELIEHTLGSALAALGEASAVVVRLHPEEAAFLRQRWAEQPAEERPQHLRLLPDSTLQRGECRLESDRGSLDATWETQLRLVGEALREAGDAEGEA